MKRFLYKLLRTGMLVGFWAGMTHALILHQQAGERPSGAPGVHALSPLGGIATLYKVVAGGSFIKRIHPSAIILFAGTIVLAILFRRAFCGWICPLGAMQEFFATIGRKLRWRLALHNHPIDANTRWIKYVVLLVILGLTYATGDLVFSAYDPWAAYAHIPAGLAELRSEFLIGGLALVVSLIGSLFIDRLWCRYFCPMGALLGIVSRPGITRIVRNRQTCVHCFNCEEVCPVDIKVESMPQVTTGECLSCGECVMACPIPSALQFRVRRNAISPPLLGLCALVVFAGVIFTSKATGVWRSLPPSMTELVEHGGELSAANIRGFMTLHDIAVAYGISVDELESELNLSEGVNTQAPVKKIMRSRGRQVEEVRQAVARQMASRGTVHGTSKQAREGDSRAAVPDIRSPEDIGPTTTLGDVENAFGVRGHVLIERLGLPPDTPRDVPLREIMRASAATVADVRRVVAAEKADDTG